VEHGTQHHLIVFMLKNVAVPNPLAWINKLGSDTSNLTCNGSRSLFVRWTIDNQYILKPVSHDSPGKAIIVKQVGERNVGVTELGCMIHCTSCKHSAKDGALAQSHYIIRTSVLETSLLWLRWNGHRSLFQFNCHSFLINRDVLVFHNFKHNLVHMNRVSIG